MHTFIFDIIPLLSTVIGSNLFIYVFRYIILLASLATIPSMIRFIVRGK